MRKMQVTIAIFSAVAVLGFASIVDAGNLGNTVWNDRNANGVQDADEEGISGVKIKIYNGDDKFTDKTNSRGRYKFKDLDGGHYDIVVAQETLPEGCYNTHDRDGNLDGKYEDKWIDEDDDFYYTHMDFGYHCPATHVVATGQVSPVTGAGTVIAILAAAIAFGAGLYFYKREKQVITKK